MPTTFGDVTKTILLKSESHKLHQAFDVVERRGTVTLSTDLIAGNITTITVNGTAAAPITYGVSHAATMAAIVVALKAIATVSDASYTGDVFTIVPADQTEDATISATVTGGASQPTIAVANNVTDIFVGQPVKLDAEGTLAPAAGSENPINVIGVAIMAGVAGEKVTVRMKAYEIVYAEAYAASHVAGPVKYKTHNATTGYCEYDDASVTYADIAGWSLDPATADGDVIRVALMS